MATDLEVKPTSYDAQIEAIAAALKSAQWNYPMRHDGKPRRTWELALNLVELGLRRPEAIVPPQWPDVAGLLTSRNPSLMIALECRFPMRSDPENTIARALQLAFIEGMVYAGQESVL